MRAARRATETPSEPFWLSTSLSLARVVVGLVIEYKLRYLILNIVQSLSEGIHSLAMSRILRFISTHAGCYILRATARAFEHNQCNLLVGAGRGKLAIPRELSAKTFCVPNSARGAVRR